MADDKKFDVTIGLSISYVSEANFADFGVVYSGMDAEQIARLEEIYDEHADELLAAMKPLRKALIAQGFAEAEIKLGKPRGENR